jgi:hypothetical protein
MVCDPALHETNLIPASENARRGVVSAPCIAPKPVKLALV